MSSNHLATNLTSHVLPLPQNPLPQSSMLMACMRHRISFCSFCGRVLGRAPQPGNLGRGAGGHRARVQKYRRDLGGGVGTIPIPDPVWYGMVECRSYERGKQLWAQPNTDIHTQIGDAQPSAPATMEDWEQWRPEGQR